MDKFITHNQSETEAVARELASRVRGDQMIALVGQLGAGKTVFVKALAKALGVSEEITSPTFVLLKSYQTKHATISALVHVDCYRLDRPEDLHDIGLEEYVADPDTLVVVEWADKIKNIPKNTMTITITNRGGDEREIIIT